MSLCTGALIGVARLVPGWVLSAEHDEADAGVRAARTTERSTRRAGLNVRGWQAGLPRSAAPKRR